MFSRSIAMEVSSFIDFVRTGAPRPLRSRRSPPRGGVGGSGRAVGRGRIIAAGGSVALAVAEIRVVGNHFRAAAVVAVLIFPVADLQPASTTAMRPLAKYWQTNSAVWRQATTSMKSVAFFAALAALEVAVHGEGEGRHGRPGLRAAQLGVTGQTAMITTRLSDIFFPPYSSLQTIMERMTPSVMRRIRSSSLGNSGALVKEINT